MTLPHPRLISLSMGGLTMTFFKQGYSPPVLVLIALMATFGLTGCEGDDGAAGAQGAQGAAGTPGADGTDGTDGTNEHPVINNNKTSSVKIFACITATYVFKANLALYDTVINLQGGYNYE